jgi:hypothetical protein
MKMGTAWTGAALVAGALLTSTAAADAWTHVCTFPKGSSTHSIAWNSVTGRAQIELFDKTYPGRITFKQKHTETGYKFNLRFEYGDRFGASESEYIVFPIDGKGWRAIGVEFVRASGERHLRSLDENEEVQCVMP